MNRFQPVKKHINALIKIWYDADIDQDYKTEEEAKKEFMDIVVAYCNAPLSLQDDLKFRLDILKMCERIGAFPPGWYTDEQMLELEEIDEEEESLTNAQQFSKKLLRVIKINDLNAPAPMIAVSA